MIPTEAFGHLVLLVTAWDTPAGSFFSTGLLRVADEGGNLGKPNKDKKRGVPKGVRENHVWWLYQSQPMPNNFLLGLTDAQRKLVLSKPAGTERITEALRHAPHSIAESQIRLLDVPEPRHRIPHIDHLLQGSAVRIDESGNWSVSHTTGG